jgi:hypothetical protein
VLHRFRELALRNNTKGLLRTITAYMLQWKESNLMTAYVPGAFLDVMILFMGQTIIDWMIITGIAKA